MTKDTFGLSRIYCLSVKIIKIFFILIVFLNSMEIVSSQTVYEYPSRLKKPMENSDLFVSCETVSEPWIVYSDKDFNVSFISPESENVKDTLRFMDKYYIADIQGEWINIIKAEVNKKARILSRQKNYGWIHSKNLLLWNRSLLDNNLSKQVYIVNNIDTWSKWNKQSYDNDSTEVSLSPGIISYHSKKIASLRYYFVYKKTEDFILIGNDERIYNNEQPKESIIGWVSKDNCFEWKSKIAIVPNMDSSAIAERKQKKISLKFFINKSDVYDYKVAKLKSKDNNFVWDFDFTETGAANSFIRFPLLSNYNEILNEKPIVAVKMFGKIDKEANTKIINQKFDIKSNCIFNPFLNAYLKETEKIPDTIIENWIKYKNTISINSWTSLYIDNLKYPLFHKEILFSAIELGNYISTLNKIIESSRENNSRILIRNIFINMLLDKKPELMQYSYENLKMTKLGMILFGLPYMSAHIKNLSLDDIGYESVFENPAYNNWISHVELVYRKLNELYNKPDNNYSFLSNDQRYFWIKQEYLP